MCLDTECHRRFFIWITLTDGRLYRKRYYDCCALWLAVTLFILASCQDAEKEGEEGEWRKRNLYRQAFKPMSFYLGHHLAPDQNTVISVVDPSLLLDLLSSFSRCFLLNASFHLLPTLFCMLLPSVFFFLLFSLPFFYFSHNRYRLNCVHLCHINSLHGTGM